MEMQSRAVIVTGGASGIGRATALLLAREGASVFVGDVDDAGGEATAALARAEGLSLEFLKLDLQRPESIAAFAATVHQQVHRVDGLGIRQREAAAVAVEVRQHLVAAAAAGVERAHVDGTDRQGADHLGRTRCRCQATQGQGLYADRARRRRWRRAVRLVGGLVLSSRRSAARAACPSVSAGTAPRPPWWSSARSPTACPCWTCPDGWRTTDCRKRWPWSWR